MNWLKDAVTWPVNWLKKSDWTQTAHGCSCYISELLLDKVKTKEGHRLTHAAAASPSQLQNNNNTKDRTGSQMQLLHLWVGVGRQTDKGQTPAYRCSRCISEPVSNNRQTKGWYWLTDAVAESLSWFQATNRLRTVTGSQVQPLHLWVGFGRQTDKGQTLANKRSCCFSATVDQKCNSW